MLVKEFSGKSEKEATNKALEELDLTEDQVRIEVIDKGKRSILGIGEDTPALIRVYYEEISANLGEFEGIIKKILSLMGVQAEVEATEESDTRIHVNIKSEDTAILIGKKGSTLDSLQFIVSLIASKHFKDTIDRHIILDVDGYRGRREETLKQIARQSAQQVKRTKRSVSLDPMSAYERRIIHLELQEDAEIETKSDGEAPYRNVKIYLKRKNGGQYNNYKNNNNASNSSVDYNSN